MLILTSHVPVNLFTGTRVLGDGIPHYSTTFSASQLGALLGGENVLLDPAFWVGMFARMNAVWPMY